LLDATVTWTSADDRYYVRAYGQNLTDQQVVGRLISPYAYSIIPIQPVTYGVAIGFRFKPSPEAPPMTPPPPPPPAALPVPAGQPEAQREFQVFFDFDKSNITDAAARVIQSAADVVRAGGIAHITVTGHTDTVGTVRYNQGLSERRAASVKSQLVTDGVSGGEISTVGVGKSGLLVPTKDGVREPQNRRAVIELQ
jgi:outer membrane protein OmpA-like peptidoglycan-associated protein